MNFLTGLTISINGKRDSYAFFFIIVDWLIKIIYYKLIKITINAPELAKVIINVILHCYELLDSIVINRGLFVTLKF